MYILSYDFVRSFAFYTATLTLTSNMCALLGRLSGRFPRSISYRRLSAFPVTAKRHFDTSVGTEELGHMEMISAIVYQLTKNLCVDDIKKGGYDAYFVDHTTGIYPVSAAGVPFSVSPIASKGDIITDLHEDLAAEQKARTTYDNILRLADDPDVKDAIKFLREREVVHYQRFGEALRYTQDQLDCKNFYAFNPEFDKRQAKTVHNRSRSYK